MKEYERIDRNYMREKVFRILAITGCCANMIGFISNFFLFGIATPTLVSGICACCIMFFSVMGIITNTEYLCGTLIIILISWFEFPYLFYVYGSATCTYFILAAVAIVIFYERKTRIILYAITGVLNLVVIITTSVLDGDREKLPNEGLIGATACSYIIVMIAVFCMIYLLIRQYEQQRGRILAISHELEYAANHDVLTKLYNRRYLMETIEGWMNCSERHFSVVLLDIDDFKLINDSQGHIYGDKVLQEFGRVLHTCVEGQGIAARYGGEEFMLLIDTIDRNEISSILYRIKKNLQEYTNGTKGIKITFSAGVEEYHSETRLNQLFRHVDKKLYEAKNTGKDKIIF